MARRLPEEIKQKVRNLLPELTHRQIHKKMGVSLGAISNIRNEKSRIITGKTIDVVPVSTQPTSIGVIGNDAQVPFHDPIAIDLFFHFCQETKPDWIDLNGDMLDFYSISQFLKDPLRKNELQKDINILVELLRRLRDENPNATIYYEYGNHENRLRKYLWAHDEIACLECLRVESLLKFNELGIIPIEKWRKQGDLYIMHGTVLSKHAGYSAKLHFEKYGVTMMHGHSHRDGKFTRRTLEGHKAVWENYCLCKLDDVEYDPFPNWTQGFSKVTMVGDRPYVEQIPIINSQYLYGGNLYGKEKQ